MTVTINGKLRDVLAFAGLLRQRKRRIGQAPPDAPRVAAMNTLAEQLHPDELDLVIDSVINETDDTRTYRMVRPDGSSLPRFRAGQYLSLTVGISGVTLTRPFSISSTPAQAAEGFVDLTIRLKPDGLVSPHIWRNWQAGTPVRSSGPLGDFYHEPLRERSHVICIAGGSGITPFKALIPDILDSTPEAKVTLFYGITNPDQVIFGSLLEQLGKDYSDRFDLVMVDSSTDTVPAAETITQAGGRPGASSNPAAYESGLITRQNISQHVPDYRDCSFFVCGPEVMYHHLRKELPDVPEGRLRCEAPGDTRDVSSRADYQELVARQPALPAQLTGAVEAAGSIRMIPMDPRETVLVAIERAGLVPPSQCRSGACGFCRSRLVSGNVFTIPESNGLRSADRKFGYFHPCSSYPLSDLTVRVPTL